MFPHALTSSVVPADRSTASGLLLLLTLLPIAALAILAFGSFGNLHLLAVLRSFGNYDPTAVPSSFGNSRLAPTGAASPALPIVKREFVSYFLAAHSDDGRLSYWDSS